MRTHFTNDTSQGVAWDAVATFATFVALIFPVVYLVFWNATLAWVVAGLLAAYVTRRQRRAVAYWRARAAATENPPWRVEINGVEVAAIDDAAFALIRASAYTDLRLYLAQALTIAKAAMRVIKHVTVVIPLGVFWSVACVAVFAPSAFLDIATALHATPPEALARAAQRVFTFAASYGAIVFAYHYLTLLGNFGMVDRFTEAIEADIRRACGVAHEGRVSLIRSTTAEAWRYV